MNEHEDRYARRAARLLREAQPQTEPSPSDGRRDAIVAAMALAIAGKARRRRVALAAGMVLAAAASVLWLVRGTDDGGGGHGARLVVEQVAGLGGVLERAGSTQPLANAGALAVGDVLRAGSEGGATLTSGQDTSLTLSTSGHLRIDELGASRRFRLVSGSLHARVAKLRDGERFVVDTPDSEVAVRGTVFRVSVVQCPAGTDRSTVEVSEGAVWIRSAGKEALLRPGESWTTACVGAPVPAAPPEATDDTNPADVRPAATPRRPAIRRAGVIRASPPLAPAPDSSKTGPGRTQPVPDQLPGKPEPLSRLAEQNDLFAAAMAAERRGQHDLALRHLDELIRRFPRGPLEESALAEKRRILSAPAPR